jgi:hypothetical protein
MPPSYSAQAEILRKQAAHFRAHETKVIRIWRPPTKKG